MSNNVTPSYLKVPKGFKSCKGKSRYDMPQELFALSDWTFIEMYHRSGGKTKAILHTIDWTNTYLETDIVGYRIMREGESLHD